MERIERAQAPASCDIQLEEYRQVNENLRFYGNLRFAQLTLFFVATGALLAALNQRGLLVGRLGQTGISAAGLLVVVVFLVMEQASVKYWLHYRDRAVVLESSLELELYSVRPSRSVFNATNATRLLFAAVAVMWTLLGVTAWM